MRQPLSPIWLADIENYRAYIHSTSDVFTGFALFFFLTETLWCHSLCVWIILISADTI